MQIIGKDFGPVLVQAKDGVIVAAARPVSYMRGWSLARVLALAGRWQWKVELTDLEREQFEQREPAEGNGHDRNNDDVHQR